MWLSEIIMITFFAERLQTTVLIMEHHATCLQLWKKWNASLIFLCISNYAIFLSIHILVISKVISDSFLRFFFLSLECTFRIKKTFFISTRVAVEIFKLFKYSSCRSSRQRCSIKKLFLKILQRSQESNCIGVSF